MVYGLDDIPGQLLLVQEVAGRLLEGIGAVKVSPTGNQQVHDVRVTIRRSYVEGAARDINRTDAYTTLHAFHLRVSWSDISSQYDFCPFHFHLQCTD